MYQQMGYINPRPIRYVEPVDSKAFSLRCDSIGFLMETLGNAESVKRIADNALSTVLDSYYYAEHDYDVHEHLGSCVFAEQFDVETLMKDMYNDCPPAIINDGVTMTICREVLINKLEHFYMDLLYQLQAGLAISNIGSVIMGSLFDPVGDSRVHYHDIPKEELLSPRYEYRVADLINNMVIITRGDLDGGIKSKNKLRF